jgi:hypothetical protein
MDNAFALLKLSASPKSRGSVRRQTRPGRGDEVADRIQETLGRL